MVLARDKRHGKPQTARSFGVSSRKVSDRNISASALVPRGKEAPQLSVDDEWVCTTQFYTLGCKGRLDGALDHHARRTIGNGRRADRKVSRRECVWRRTSIADLNPIRTSTVKAFEPDGSKTERRPGRTAHAALGTHVKASGLSCVHAILPIPAAAEQACAANHTKGLCRMHKPVAHRLWPMRYILPPSEWCRPQGSNARAVRTLFLQQIAVRVHGRRQDAGTQLR